MDTIKPVFELNEDDYILCHCWTGDEEGNNWICVVKKDKNKENAWEATYRTKSIKNNDPHGNEFEKSGQRLEIVDISEEEMIRKVSNILDQVSLLYPYKDFILIQGNKDKLFEILKDKPYMKTTNL